MAIDKLITTRKEHTCSCCGKVIPKGSKAWYVSKKMPKYEYTSDDEEKQVGIDYFRAYFCFDKTANFECNSEGGIEIKTMVPSCALDDVIVGEEQCIIPDVSQRSELACLHKVYKQCNVIEKCCDVCRCYKPYKQACD